MLTYCITVLLFAGAALLAAALAERFLHREQSASAAGDAEEGALPLIWFRTARRRKTAALVLGAVTGLGAGFTVGLSPALVPLLAAFAGMVCGGLIDDQLRIIPNEIPLCMVMASAVSMLLLFLVQRQMMLPFAFSCLVGGAASFLLMLLVCLVSRGGFGMGDVKLIGALGLLCGGVCVLGTLFLATFAAALCSLWMLLRRKAGVRSSMPFGPFLMAGYAAAVILGIC